MKKIISLGNDEPTSIEEISEFDLCVYKYEYEGYEGSGEFLGVIGNKINYYSLDHCSCYGPLDDINQPQWTCTIEEFLANDDVHQYTIDDSDVEKEFRTQLTNYIPSTDNNLVFSKRFNLDDLTPISEERIFNVNNIKESIIDHNVLTIVSKKSYEEIDQIFNSMLVDLYRQKVLDFQKEIKEVEQRGRNATSFIIKQVEKQIPLIRKDPKYNLVLNNPYVHAPVSG